MRIVALWATKLVQFLHEAILSGDISFLAETLYQKGLQGLNFHLTLQYVKNVGLQYILDKRTLKIKDAGVSSWGIVEL